jgi:hypothetical protein
MALIRYSDGRVAVVRIERYRIMISHTVTYKNKLTAVVYENSPAPHKRRYDAEILRCIDAVIRMDCIHLLLASRRENHDKNSIIPRLWLAEMLAGL